MTKLYKSAMVKIPIKRLYNRLRVLIATIKVGIKAHKYLFLTLKKISPSGANMLTAVKAPNTAGPTRDNHLLTSLGNSN